MYARAAIQVVSLALVLLKPALVVIKIIIYTWENVWIFVLKDTRFQEMSVDNVIFLTIVLM